MESVLAYYNPNSQLVTSVNFIGPQETLIYRVPPLISSAG